MTLRNVIPVRVYFLPLKLEKDAVSFKIFLSSVTIEFFENIYAAKNIFPNEFSYLVILDLGLLRIYNVLIIFHLYLFFITGGQISHRRMCVEL